MSRLVAIEELAETAANKRLVALTGAGVSTESGIPDYRGPETRRRARNPLQYRAFLDSVEARRRYWQRSHAAWGRFSESRPNDGHRALAELEARGVLAGVVTQNVDGLHQAAGTESLVELHGNLSRTCCLWCGATESRDRVQERLTAANGAVARVSALAPDGDADLDSVGAREFALVACELCGGILKPDVVFFGESVPRAVTAAARSLVAEAEMLLVLGTSLAVYSGLRWLKEARANGASIALVNLGEPSRGHELIDMRVEGATGVLLPALVGALLD